MLRCYQDTPHTGEIQIALSRKKKTQTVNHTDTQSKSQEKQSTVLSHKYIIKELNIRALNLVCKAVHTFRSAATAYS